MLQLCVYEKCIQISLLNRLCYMIWSFKSMHITHGHCGWLRTPWNNAIQAYIFTATTSLCLVACFPILALCSAMKIAYVLYVYPCHWTSDQLSWSKVCYSGNYAAISLSLFVSFLLVNWHRKLLWNSEWGNLHAIVSPCIKVYSLIIHTCMPSTYLWTPQPVWYTMW